MWKRAKTAYREVNSWWDRHVKFMMMLGLIVLAAICLTQYVDKDTQADNSSEAVRGLSVALQIQQQEAARGGTAIVTPPTASIIKHPNEVLNRPEAVVLMPGSVTKSNVLSYVDQLFSQYLTSHPASQVNYAALRTYINTRVAKLATTASASATSSATASSSIDFSALQTYINQQIAAYASAHPAQPGETGATGPSGAKGEQGDPGPDCPSGYGPTAVVQPDGGAVVLCSSAPVPTSPIASPSGS